MNTNNLSVTDIDFEKLDEVTQNGDFSDDQRDHLQTMIDGRFILDWYSFAYLCGYHFVKHLGDKFFMKRAKLPYKYLHGCVICSLKDINKI